MKPLIVIASLFLLFGTFFACGEQPVPGVVAESAPKAPQLYADTFLSLRTTDFSSEDYAYGLGVGYQFNKHFAMDVRTAHAGLDVNGSAVTDLGARVVARLPWKFLSPYSFLGANFDLERDEWHLMPGGGVELGVSKQLKGLSVFSELSLDTRLDNGSLADTGFHVTGGLRFRF